MATINGTGASESLNGTGSADTIKGLGGNDTINGGAGADSVEGGEGNDYIVAGSGGGDTLKGGNGIDSLELSLFGAAASFDLTGMTPLNTVTISGGLRVSGFEIVNVFCGAFNDRIVNGDVGGWLNGAQGNDTIISGAGDDYIRGGVGDDSLTGGGGFDRVGFFTEAAANGCTVDLRLQGTVQNTGGGMDFLSGFENVSGTAKHDVITGDAGSNILWGSGDGTAAADGNDVLTGNGGDDLIISSDGAHTLNGGEGIDTLSVWGNGLDTSGGMVINLSLQGAAAQDTTRGLMVIRNFENLSGSIHDDLLTGDQFANGLAGAGGDDTLLGGGANDRLYGDGMIESDWPYAISGPIGEFEARYGGDYVTPGHDVLDGGKADDILVGGGLGDELTGGKGADTFRYIRLEDSTAGGEDLIHDFAHASDFLDVSAIDANDNAAGDQAFTLVNALTGAAGQAALVYDRETLTTSVLLDTDGDGEADAVILMTGRFTLATMGDGSFVA